MDARMKDCPSCKRQIQADASFCPYCGARFIVTFRGYCQNCHSVQNLDSAYHCAVCGSEVIDRQAHSQFLADSQAGGGALPGLVQPLDEAAPAGKSTAFTPAAPPSKAGKGCAGCLRGAAVLIAVLAGAYLVAYTVSDPFRAWVRSLPGEVSQKEGEGAVLPAATSAASPQRFPVPQATDTPFPTSTPDIDLPEVSANALCAGNAADGLTCLDDSGWIPVPKEQLPRTGSIEDLASCAGRMFAMVSGRLYGYSEGAWQEYSWRGGTMNVIACGVGEDIWIVGYSAAHRFDGLSWTEYPYETVFAGHDSFRIEDAVIAPDGALWAVSVDNVLHFDGETWALFEREKDLKARDSLTGIAVDSQGIPWVTYLSGLATYSGSAWTNVARPGSTHVNTVTIDAADQVWVGTDGGVSMYLRGSGSWQRYPIYKMGGRVKALAMDGQERMWVGTDWGLAVLENGTYTFYRMASSDLLMNDVSHLSVSGKGPRLPPPVEKAPGSLTGRLVEGDQPLKGARVEVCVQEMGIIFTGATPCSSQPFMVVSTTNTDGDFTITDLPPGYYTFTFQTPDGGWKVRSRTLAIGSVQVLVKPGEENYLGEMDINE